MNNNIQTYTNESISLPVREVDGQIYFDAEATAIGLGISQVSRSGNTIARWDRVRKYLSTPNSGCEIKKGSWITEPQFYKLAIKANNAVAEKFQNWVTEEVLPKTQN